MTNNLPPDHPMYGRYDERRVVSADQLLRLIAESAARCSSNPCFVADLDDCVYMTSRTAFIMEHFFAQLGNGKQWRSDALRLFREGRAAYSARENWRLVTGEAGEPHADAWFTYWRRHFFSPTMCTMDAPQPGVLYFLRRAWRYADIAYLTGRHEVEIGGEFPDGMKAYTEKALARDGLSCRRLVCKPSFAMSDAKFKQGWFEREFADNPGRIAGFVDNEPGYVVDFLRLAQAAGQEHPLAVFFESVCGTPVDLPPEVYVLRNFTLF